jgi:drug/metabolite transporter (DMT)-like permease
VAPLVTGARLVAAPVAALVGTAEPVLGPLWVWLFMSEMPSGRTLIGGAIVLAALVAHLGWRSRAALAQRGRGTGS